MHEIVRAAELGDEISMSAIMPRGFLKFIIQHGKFFHVIVRRHLTQQIRRTQRVADHSFCVTVEADAFEEGVNAGASDHVLHGMNVGVRKTFRCEKLMREFQTTEHMRGSIFRASAGRGVIATFQIPGVVQQNSDETEFKEMLRNLRLHARGLTAAEQSRHTERALQRVFKVVITRVNGLIVGVASGETFLCPTKDSRDEVVIALGEHREISRLNVGFHSSRIIRGDLWKHRSDNNARRICLHEKVVA